MSVRSFKCSHDWLDVYPTEPDDVCPKCRADVPPCKSYASVEALDEFLGAAASGNARRRVVCPQCEFVVTNWPGLCASTGAASSSCNAIAMGHRALPLEMIACHSAALGSTEFASTSFKNESAAQQKPLPRAAAFLLDKCPI